MVGGARGGLGVQLAEQVLGGDWKGVMAIGAQEKKQGVSEDVKWEVGPVLRGRSWLDPREG